MKTEARNGNGKSADAVLDKAEELITKPSRGKNVATSITIPELKLGLLTLTLVGDTPLIMHRFAEKAIEKMLLKHMGEAEQKHDRKVPENDFLACFHFIGKQPTVVKKGDEVYAKGRWGFPAGGVRSAAVSACRQVAGVKMTYARGVFQVLADDPSKNLVEVFGDPKMRRDITRNSNGQPDVRFRPEFPEWSIKLTIQYDTKCISPAQLANLYNQAGFSVGLGDWRPERDGSNGRFHVASTDEISVVKGRA